MQLNETFLESGKNEPKHTAFCQRRTSCFIRQSTQKATAQNNWKHLKLGLPLAYRPPATNGRECAINSLRFMIRSVNAKRRPVTDNWRKTAARATACASRHVSE